MISLLIRLFRKKPIIYLRSDGYAEYEAILGKIGSAIYHFMFIILASCSNFISCRSYILRGKKGRIVSPSQLDSIWIRKPKKIDVKSFKLLYVGRLKIEKGIYALADLIKNKRGVDLNIITAEKNSSHKINQSNIKIKFTNNKAKLIKYYDEHNIFILPSYTEGHPMVVLEALARRRPVIIFEEIKHIIGEKKGIFVTKRNFLSLFKMLNYIKKDYKKIQKEMKKNNLPTQKEFIEEMSNSILKFD